MNKDNKMGAVASLRDRREDWFEKASMRMTEEEKTCDGTRKHTKSSVIAKGQDPARNIHSEGSLFGTYA
ncbi:MAG: hypothetical protein ACF8AM_04065 [Rhodopirellula sp. JB055]|uniref:hypothetical protein n=1 Tax=Rhodopirellula sp. JB055 TaxID=3342846 RepID=UPI00370B286F